MARITVQKNKNLKALTTGAIILTVIVCILIVVLVIVNIIGSFDKTVYADIKVADKGTITVALDPDAAPITVDNFVSLAKSGFYDGLTFHRITSGFMIQGGDPKGDGTGKSDTSIKGEFSENGIDNPISHERGVISMARSKEYDSATCQFFIVHQDNPDWDGKYAAFGRVTSGMDIVDKICEEAVPIDSNGLIAPESQPVITSVTIRE